ncbi:hypothetical protein [Streptomyces celluloflavus]|uniref:hypothetical protein n=1 Tax=Streptomyces celluloflavus TaxID=58344 RepID=UPI0036828B21
MASTVPVGGIAPVSVRSTTTTPTADIDATPRQITELTVAAWRMVRTQPVRHKRAEYGLTNSRH